VSPFFGIEASRPVQIAAAVAIFLVLLLIFFLVARKLAGARLMMPGSGRNRQPRIGIVDIYDLDKQRQLVLLRRDNVEHLLLIGGLNDVVIETNIVRVAGARSSAQAQDAGPERLEPVLDQAPRPQVESSGRPSIETQLAAQLGSLVRRPAGESDADQELSPVVHAGGPASAHPEPVLRPDAVTVSAAPAVQALRAEARAPVVPSAPSAPEPVVERREPRPVVAPPAFQSRPTPVPPAPPALPAPPAPPAPEVVRAPDPAPVERDMPPEKQGPDAAVLSDMARQLEAALKRPAMPVPPPPLPAAPRPAPGPLDDEDELLEPDPVQEAPVAPHEEAPEEDDHGEHPEPAQAEPVRADEPPRLSSEPFLPAPEPAQPAPPSPARAAEAPGPSSKAPDPFSVEDIEAEFARLLGRPLDPGKKG
jgi:flagellar protein FliO/FliZ